MILTKRKLSIDNKLFLLILMITFTVFIFTSDGHRYTFDEDVTQRQSLRIATLQPDPRYVQGESTFFFEYPEYFPKNTRITLCQNGILCSSVPIGSSLTQVPFILINHNFHIITKDILWTTEDFDDPHYVLWRNSLEPDFTFLELFYGPAFSALSVGTFFIVCRTFNFTQKTSIILALLYGLTTITWAYSKTSLNVIPFTFFVLLGILFFRKFRINQSNINLIFCSISFGFAFLTRNDGVLFIIPLFLFLMYDLRGKNEKIKKFFSFVVPVTLSYGIYRIIEFVRIGYSNTDTPLDFIGGYDAIPLHIALFGLLFSPGTGLLIFAPILFTTFLAFFDFYKKNKFECLLFLSFIIIFLIFYGSFSYWHGLNAWGARYLFSVVPFLLLPLGASIEKRNNKLFKISLVILGSLGVFFNLMYVIQDVTWFVWGDIEGLRGGLYSLGRGPDAPVRIHPLTIWTFEFSQLTHSILRAFYHLQPDIFLLKVLGSQIFTLVFVAIIAPLTYFLLRLLSQNKLTISKP